MKRQHNEENKWLDFLNSESIMTLTASIFFGAVYWQIFNLFGEIFLWGDLTVFSYRFLFSLALIGLISIYLIIRYSEVFISLFATLCEDYSRKLYYIKKRFNYLEQHFFDS